MSALVILAGLIAGGLVLQTTTRDDPDPAGVVVDAGIAIPAARVEPTLASTWFCAGGTATPGGFGEHVIYLTNPTDRDRDATVTVLIGEIADPPPVPDAGATSSTSSSSTTTTTEPAPSTTVDGEPPTASIEVRAQSRAAVRISDIVEAELAGAIIEVEGGEIAVEHELTGDLGRATAPCSTTASSQWSFPWGVTERGARELFVFMNPFPDDATVDINFATDEGVRNTLRFQGFVVPGRSVVGAYIDEDVTRKAQVSAQIQVRGGRLVIDRVQTFDGTDDREGITVGLGAPSPAETWMFPDGLTGTGLTEQIVVFNPSEGVAEVEVEVRLDDPTTNGTPEPFELTIAPGRYAIVDLHNEERVPGGVAHSSIARSLNGVPVVAERAVTAAEGAERLGVSATLGSPIGAPIWYFPGGGTSAERDEFITLFNVSEDEIVTFNVVALAAGRRIEIEGLQDLAIEPGSRLSVRLGNHIEREDLPLVVTADGPVVAERGLYRAGGRGISQSMGIPLDDRIEVPDPIEG